MNSLEPAALKHRSFERRQSLAAAGQPRFGHSRRERRPRPLEKCAPGAIEIVEMLIVTEQDGVESADIVRRDRGSGRFLQMGRTGIVAGRIKGRIGQHPQAVELDEDRRTANQGQRDLAPVHEKPPFPRSRADRGNGGVHDDLFLGRLQRLRAPEVVCDLTAVLFAYITAPNSSRTSAHSPPNSRCCGPDVA